ncbi:MAG TPA: VOC family protein [Verrucomicrobiae bacterium]|nr:VOC family protein [Verrucomicrobiae bacterium]
MIQEIAFTAYAVTDIRKSRDFYENVLGLKPNSEYNGSGNPDYIEYDLGPGTFAIGKSEMWKPSEDGASIAFEVEDFDKALARIKEKNVPIKMGPYDFPSCRMVVVLDPDKNKLTLHKRKK